MVRRLASFAISLVLSVLVLAAPALANFSFQSFGYSAFNEDGSPDPQAGSHPWEMTTSFLIGGQNDVKDVEVDSPLGLVGSPDVTPKCSIEDFTTAPDKERGVIPEESSFLYSGANCPNDTQIGVADVRLPGHNDLGVYNLVPPPGYPAEFGFNYLGAPVLLRASLRSDGSYGLSVRASDISQTLSVYGAAVTLWGVPADSRHDELRGECLGLEGQSVAAEVKGGCPSGIAPVPFLTLPTNCAAAPPAMSIFADSWQDPVRSLDTEGVTEEAVNHDAHGNPVGITGCEHLDFSPALSIRPAEHGRKLPDRTGSRPERPPERKPQRPRRGEPAGRGSDAAAGSGREPLGCRWSRSMHARTSSN